MATEYIINQGYFLLTFMVGVWVGVGFSFLLMAFFKD